MADITAADVTYTIEKSSRPWGPGTVYRRIVKLAFGDGALTYPAGGVPLDKAKLGCPTHVEKLAVLGGPTVTAFWMPDVAAVKLKGYEINAAGAGDEGPIELDAADTPAAQELKVEVEGW